MERGRQFVDAVAAKLIGGVDSELCIQIADDLALFAESAGDDVHVGAVCGVMRNGYAGCQPFVVWVGVDKQQTGRSLETTSRLTLPSGAQLLASRVGRP